MMAANERRLATQAPTFLFRWGTSLGLLSLGVALLACLAPETVSRRALAQSGTAGANGASGTNGAAPNAARSDARAADRGAATRSAPAADKKPAETRPVRPPYKDGDLLVCSFDHIKFPMERNAEFKRELITKEIEALHGKKIRIRGWILPSARQKFSSFVLVRDNQECCFGPGAMLYDCIMVHMKPGKTAEFTTFPVAVEGTFQIDIYKDELEGTVLAIYRMDADSVR